MTMVSDDSLLTPEQAAYRLGITPELLFAYVRYAPKIFLGHQRRLPSVQKSGKTFFRVKDLDEFDAYLREPWCQPGDKRPAVPAYIDEYLRVECGGQCARCGKGFHLQNAHIVDFAVSRSHYHHNIIRLCSNCHDEFDSKKLISAEELNVIKKKLITHIRQRSVERSSRSRHAIHRPPTPVSSFYGRRKEMDLLVSALNAHRVVSVQGPGGIGKTQLLLKALSTLSCESRDVWVECEAFTSVADLEMALLTTLAIDDGLIQLPLGELVDRSATRLILDGVERLPSVHKSNQIEDFLARLARDTKSTQIIFTTQMNLFAVDIQARISVGSLDEEASRLILTGAADQSEVVSDDESLRFLLEFCEGHPLALSLVGGLIRHFGSSVHAVTRIRQYWSETIAIPCRETQNSSTSLDACLSIAYDALSIEERRLLWLVSSCPAGIYSQMLEVGRYGITDFLRSIGGLRRWHLLIVRQSGSQLERLYVLSPIRAFTLDRFKKEAPAEVERLQYEITQFWLVQALVLDTEHLQAGDVAFGMARFQEEWPNIMNAFYGAVQLAASQPRYLDVVGTLACSLMVFCFVSGTFMRGVEILHIGADAACTNGDYRRASMLLLQYATLSQRLHDIALVKDAASQLASVANDNKDALIQGRTSHVQGILATLEAQYDEAEVHFAAAERYYNEATKLESPSCPTDLDGEEVTSDLEMIAQTLMGRGFALERTARSSEALLLYQKAEAICQKMNDQVNLGSIFHQQGNCYANLKNYQFAVDMYHVAATQFHSIGMAEYLSNSLCELAFVLLDYDPRSTIDEFISFELVQAGLLDVQAQLISVFMETPEPNVIRIREAVRKAFGLVILVSFTSHPEPLLAWTQDIRKQLIDSLCKKYGSSSRKFDGLTFLVMRMDHIAALAGNLGVADLENPPTAEWIDQVAALCYGFFDFATDPVRAFDWLAVYLRRHRQVPGISAQELFERASILAQ